MLPNTLYYKLLDETAYVPRRATLRSAGLDLYSPISVSIKGGEKFLIDLRLQIVLPEGTYGRLASRSSLSWKNFIIVGAGVIDPDYQGSLKVLIFNLGKETFHVKKGDAIAQLICEKIMVPELQEHVAPITTRTERGGGGFGSTNAK